MATFDYLENNDGPNDSISITIQNLLSDSDKLQLQIISEKFQLLSEMTEGVCEGHLNGLFVVGEPGLGKTHTVDRIVDAYSSKRPISRCTGHVTPFELYRRLHDNQSGLFVFDDCDDVFSNISCLNILKAAMDSRQHRILNWASSRASDAEKEFEFFGQVIVITNADLRRSVHHKAVLDRVHNVYVTMTPEQRVLRIMDIADKLDTAPADICFAVAQFLKTHSSRLGERISVRSFVKCMDLARFKPNGWQRLAMNTALELE